MSKQRKDRKKKNEKKARDLLKLQLNMTAPEDLDNDDRALGGEEVFDLGEGEREAKRQGRSDDLHAALIDEDGMSEDEAESSEEEETDLDELDSDEERERRLGALEGQLDGLYDEYKERMIERDAKWKAKEARAKDRNYDSWHGIQEGSDEDDGVEKTFRAGPARAPRRGDADEEEEVSDDGGWDLLAQQKAKLGEEVDSSDSEDEQPRVVKRKAANGWDDEDDEVVPSAPAKRGRGLVTSLTEKEERAQMSRQAQVWFDQSVFKGVGDLAALDGEDEEEEDADVEDGDDEDEDMGAEEADDMEMDDASEALDEDEFEIVPVDRDGGEEWDVDNEDQDEVKKKIIQGESAPSPVESSSSWQTRVFSRLRRSSSRPSLSTGKPPPTSSSTTASTGYPPSTRTVFPPGSSTTSPSSINPTSRSRRRRSTRFGIVNVLSTLDRSRRWPRRRRGRSSRRCRGLRRPSERPTA